MGSTVENALINLSKYINARLTNEPKRCLLLTAWLIFQPPTTNLTDKHVQALNHADVLDVNGLFRYNLRFCALVY